MTVQRGTMLIKRRGQSILEYATLFAVIASVLIAMAIFFKRSGNQMVRKAADQLGEGQQFSPLATTGTSGRSWNSNSVMTSIETGLQTTSITTDNSTEFQNMASNATLDTERLFYK